MGVLDLFPKKDLRYYMLDDSVNANNTSKGGSLWLLKFHLFSIIRLRRATL